MSSHHCCPFQALKFHSFVDRDMFMRYRGGGVGHAAVREATDSFMADRDEHDIRFHAEHQAGHGEPGASTAADLQDDEDEEDWNVMDDLHESLNELRDEEAAAADDNAPPVDGNSTEDEEESQDEEEVNDVDMGSW